MQKASLRPVDMVMVRRYRERAPRGPVGIVPRSEMCRCSETPEGVSVPLQPKLTMSICLGVSRVPPPEKVKRGL
ncbi:hypothetical protein EYF80_030226 [Liparis tanakae]|uniref:Uncharacterized protein n=1 Tax=Liparis tanakae TaxID=230148 RepID=A0A4Z2H1D6_9TELE|nr:hypothetical protein EYF80_030226 [Liparis tanakae]